MNLELTPQQADRLRHILADYLNDLRMEVADTDSMDYREKLKVTEAFLKDVIARLDTGH